MSMPFGLSIILTTGVKSLTGDPSFTARIPTEVASAFQPTLRVYSPLTLVAEKLSMDLKVRRPSLTAKPSVPSFSSPNVMAPESSITANLLPSKLSLPASVTSTEILPPGLNTNFPDFNCKLTDFRSAAPLSDSKLNFSESATTTFAAANSATARAVDGNFIDSDRPNLVELQGNNDSVWGICGKHATEFFHPLFIYIRS